ncbi:ABC transporter ATP-binding protein [Aestuariibacter halophilus]|uniref:ABC transporter ATP-binding protein n=1 Tax=Fluctibacter halophilus TaxID=226011 RepID=A0ABS8G3U3_9ALTE|nr:ABC transporter ATP-binding protein [Aestuariibacter halophilus]MCC2615205.1 ABC transporter ATP-binding protein [Aestuariibacter halophilus]
MLELEQVCLAYNNNTVVEDVSFTLPRGSIGCLLGSSGSGKSTLLRGIAGFESLTSGRIVLNQRVVSHGTTHIAPEHRRVAMVFQDFALFPHLTCLQNVTFGLQAMAEQERIAIAQRQLAMVGLQAYAEAYPHALSGGQQQRVALARALATSPDVLLLDEPFSSLDAGLRDSLAREVRQLIKDAGITALLVTHDQQEAFAFADHIGVMHQGQLQQWATAYELYHRPATAFVANFVGQGVFIPGSAQGGSVNTVLGTFRLAHPHEEQGPVRVLIRPDDIVHDDHSPYQARVVRRAFRGAHIQYELALDDQTRVLCLAPSHHDHPVDARFGIRVDLEHVVVFKP